LTPQDSLAKRTISSTLWQTAASLISSLILFVRSILLARWLPVEAFGVYGYAGAIIIITSRLASFGMGPGLLHRAPETEDEDTAAATHFTLKLLFTTIWALLLLSYAAFFAEPQYRRALLALTLIHAILQLTETPRLILARRVVHRRLSLLAVLNVTLSSFAALLLARLGQPMWALIATDFASLTVSIIGLYLWHPVWRPKLSWSPDIVRYFLSFGARNSPGSLLHALLDRVDDAWTGSRLGSTAAGFYTKAYSFATYPRRVIAGPLTSVSGGSYAELKFDRQGLSQAFFRINATLVRAGFFAGGLLALIAPEFIRIVLGDKWVPMLDAYRLMLVFTLLDPLKNTVANLFNAVGKPEQVTFARLAQLPVLVIGLSLLGPRLGITGVALAVDAMLLVGMGILFWQARKHVDFSLVQLFGTPAAALIIGMVISRGLLAIPGVLGSDWRTGSVKTVGFVVIYVAILYTLERKQTTKMAKWTISAIKWR